MSNNINNINYIINNYNNKKVIQIRSISLFELVDTYVK